MLKKFSILFLLSSSLFLTACFGSDTNDTGTNSTIVGREYSGQNYSILVPMDWEIIEQNKFTSSIPADIDVGFRSNIKNETFTANTSIAINSFEEDIQIKDFALATLSKARKNLYAFKEISFNEDTVDSTIGPLSSYVMEFEGRKTSKDSLVKFIQVFVEKNKIIYTITGAYAENEDESIVKTLIEMINSFTLK